MRMKRGEELYLEVYIDLIFLINFLMNLILLSIVKRVLKWESRLFRRILGGAIGALGACLLALFPTRNQFIQFIISYIIICIVMIWVSYKPKTWQMVLKGVLVLYLATFFLGGLFNSLYYHSMLGFYFHELINGRLPINLSGWKIVLLIISGIIGILLLLKIISDFRRGNDDLYDVKLYFKDKSLVLRGLLDTGNNLYDPIFGKPVNVIEYSSIIKLLSEEDADYIKKIIDNNQGLTVSNNSLNVFMIPFKSIGKKNGLLPAIKIDKLEIIKGNDTIYNENVLTGIWTGHLSKQGKYQLILHRDLM